MRWLKFLLVFLMIALAVPGFAQESDAPYFYYFDWSADGFVIEHADGSDSRIIGEGIMGDWGSISIQPR